MLLYSNNKCITIKAYLNCRNRFQNNLNNTINSEKDAVIITVENNVFIPKNDAITTEIDG